jgi:NitT/TauT family transport system permease protein
VRAIRIACPGAPPSASLARQIFTHGFTLLILLGWYGLSRILPPYLAPSPFAVLQNVGRFASEMPLFIHLVASLAHVGIALFASFFIGTALAVLSKEIGPLDVLIRGRLLPLVNSFPGVGWAMLALLWFGLGNFSVVFSIALVLLPAAIINMRSAIDQIDTELLEMAHSFGRRRLAIVRRIMLPGLLPLAFATLRINFGTSWKIALTAELFGGGSGLGYLMNLARQSYDTAMIFAIFVLMVLLVYGGDRVVFEPAARLLRRLYGR